MSTLRMYSMTETDLMEVAASIKVVILRGLVANNHLTEDEADEWAGNHTIILHKPKWGLFRRVFGKAKDDDGTDVEWTLVSRVMEQKP
ncbi:MAG: hypothetical protein KAJ55_00165 [Anaerolineales bacterium]|nr:hypothetical protein [Anaerolineales bacterium]